MSLLSFVIHLAVLIALLLAIFLVRAYLRRCPPGRDPAYRTPHRESPGNCARIPPRVYRRPDPMIYSQSYLMAQGLAVTWDNPDIHLERNGAPASSHDLLPDTDYEIVARVWNGSPFAPAVNLPVRFSYIDFGIGGATIPIGEVRVDLPVNGAPGHPTFARIPWRTPATPGHYCIRVTLVWADDANPANNVGQENVDVKPLNSPRAVFRFPLRNDAPTRQAYRLTADTYTIPPQRPCGDEVPARTVRLTSQETDAKRAAALARHGVAAFAVPREWRIAIEPPELALEPGKAREITVEITAPDDFRGEQVFNIAAFTGATLAGGVTLHVRA